MGVHVGVCQQAEFFALVGGEKVGFVDDHDDVFAAFVFFGGEQVGGLGDQVCFVESGAAAERGDDAGVETADADRRVADIDDCVSGIGGWQRCCCFEPAERWPSTACAHYVMTFPLRSRPSEQLDANGSSRRPSVFSDC